MRRRKEIYITQPVLRNNRNLFRKKHLFERKREDTLKSSDGKLVFKKASEEKLRTIREKMSKERFFYRVLECVLVLMATLVFAIAVYSVVSNEKERQKILKEKEKKAYVKLNMPKYNFYINDGNKWLRKGHYRNAQYQFKKALELFPEDQLAKEKLRIVNLKRKIK
ncbi:hypothetical protein [Tenacibaculum xiamenense]|uniref:hypothetical protein n=1 Tax=Tenacibaculum xiamenense TaxID=1261553 RepID=UPI003894965A